jgi:hypothetical protein
MYLLVISTAISVQLGQCVYAISRYGSGYNHGCDDTKLADQSEIYINQPERGPNFHSHTFMRGYESCFNSCSIHQSNKLPSSDPPRQTPSSLIIKPRMMMQVLGTAIIIARLVVIPGIALAISKLMRGKRRERQHFSDTVNESILRKQIMSARNVSGSLT